MSITNIRVAIETAVNAMSPSLPTVWDNTKYTPVKGTPWQRVNMFYVQPDNSEFGSNYQESGYVQISLFYPLGVGSADIESRIQLIRNAFKRGSTFAYSGNSVTVNKTPSILIGEQEDEWYSKIVIIYFYSNVGL